MEKDNNINDEILGKNIDADNIDAIVSQMTDEEHEICATETETKSKRKLLKEQLLVSAGLGNAHYQYCCH